MGAGEKPKRKTETNMNHDEFQSICSALGAPHRGWQKAAVDKARSLGLHVSQPTISQIYNDPEKSISPRVAHLMRALQDGVVSGDIPTGHHKPSGDGSTSETYRDPDDDLSDDQIINDIGDRFTTFDECIEQVVCGSRQGCLVSGPPGCGKSHCVEKYEEQAEGHYEMIKGDISAVNLYKALFRAMDGGVLVFDDCDGVFADETKLNLLKAALEVRPPGKERKICWLKESNTLIAEDIPNSFDFQGRILFMTNIDFEREIERGNKIAEHLKALLSRSGYMSLGLHSKRRRMLRVVQVCRDTEIMADNGITDPEVQDEILGFVMENAEKWRELSLRLIVLLCNYRKNIPSKWEKHATALLMRKR